MPQLSRVSVRRADKRFPMTSPQVEREIGGRIKEARGWSVDLDDAELTIHVELLTDRGVLLLRQGTRARRAADGHSRPRGVPAVGRHRLAGGGAPHDEARLRGHASFTSTAIRSCRAPRRRRRASSSALLTTWQQRSRLYLVAFGEIQQQVVLAVPGPMRVVVYRRLMLRIAETIARARGAQALVTGDVVGQVASQTLENLPVDRQRRDAADLPAADRHGQGRDHGRGAAARHAIRSRSFPIRTAARCSRRAIR